MVKLFSENTGIILVTGSTGSGKSTTLHTNDSLGAINRLIGLGVDPNMITSSLIGVVSQRLARRICPHCKVAYSPSENLFKEFFVTPPADISWVKGQGCHECNYTGFKGRLALAELWEPSQSDIMLINKRAPMDDLRVSARQSTIPIMEEAMGKLKAGETSLEELTRILPYSFIKDYRQGQISGSDPA